MVVTNPTDFLDAVQSRSALLFTFSGVLKSGGRSPVLMRGIVVTKIFRARFGFSSPELTPDGTSHLLVLQQLGAAWLTIKLVMEPGGYAFGDYVKVGLPLLLLTLLVTVALVAMIYPL
jgi:hypothetical protein